jgi:hypothetical protein
LALALMVFGLARPLSFSDWSSANEVAFQSLNAPAIGVTLAESTSSFGLVAFQSLPLLTSVYDLSPALTEISPRLSAVRSQSVLSRNSIGRLSTRLRLNCLTRKVWGASAFLS